MCRGGCFLHYPHGCEKDHIAPQRCRKEEGHGRKMGVGVCSYFKAWRLALSSVGHSQRCTPSKFLKSSTYNIHFKSYLMLRVLA